MKIWMWLSWSGRDGVAVGINAPMILKRNFAVRQLQIAQDPDLKVCQLRENMLWGLCNASKLKLEMYVRLAYGATVWV